MSVWDGIIMDDCTSASGTLTEEQWREFAKDFNWDAGKLVSGSIPYIKKEDKDMMGLYEVNIVNTKENKEVVSNLRMIAKDEDKAKMKALTDFCSVVDIDNCTFFVRCIGQWESKKPKEVKIVKE